MVFKIKWKNGTRVINEFVFDCAIMIETGFNFYFDSNIEKIFGCKVPLFKNDSTISFETKLTALDYPSWRWCEFNHIYKMLRRVWKWLLEACDCCYKFTVNACLIVVFESKPWVCLSENVNTPFVISAQQFV